MQRAFYETQKQITKSITADLLSLLPAPTRVSCKTPTTLVLQTVGPPASAISLGRLDFRDDGFLKVFSATQARHAGSRSTYHPHSDYIIYKTNGSVFREIENSLDSRDEAAALIYLPAGFYKIQALDNSYGRVIVPVLIEPWRTTKVYLESRASSELLNPSNSVCLPDGRMVGWRAREQTPKIDQGSH